MKRRGIATPIAIWIVTLLICSLLYIILNLAVSQFQAIQVSQYPTGYFIPDVLTALNSIWTWVLGIVFFGGIPFVYREAQRSKEYG